MPASSNATDAGALLAALQHGDSFFPSGAVAFSWGLETLRADGAVAAADDVQRFIAGQLAGRWATCDRPALLAAHRRAATPDEVAAVDAELEALTLAREMREGSRRAGAALLGVHERLGTPGAVAYRRRVQAGAAPGHLAVVQGLVWQATGLDETAAAAVSAHALCVAQLGAALRLGVIGHVEAQRILASLRPEIRRILAEPPPPVGALRAFTPATDIAVMRHETATVRLFAN
ncbi:MAG TPA: urease accessory UreF family protein [Dongiaceae bacterium]|nr:urease accessory UreF family protein [Dongiaceae bacterium]